MAPTPTIPDTQEGLEEYLSDMSKVTAAIREGTFGDVVKGYIANITKRDSSIEDQIKSSVDKVFNDFCTEHGIKPEELSAAMAKGDITRPQLAPFDRRDQASVTSQVRKQGLYNKSAAGASVDKAKLFADAGEYFRAVHVNQTDPALLAKRPDLLRIQNEYSSQVPAEGGFLIPETVRSEMLELALETAIVRPRATVIPMDTLRTVIPVLESTSNVSSIMGGVVAYWTEEGAAMIESSAKFGRIALEAKELTAYAVAPNALLADAAAFGSFIQQSFPRAIAWFEDLGFLRGTGVGEPLGILKAPALVTQAKESGQAAATIVWENIIKMYARMLPTSLGAAEWVVNQETFPELATMALSVGTGGGPIWLNNGADGPPMTILGRPVRVTEKADALGTAGDVNFLDFNYYLIGDRQAMQAASSEHYRFMNNETAFRIVERVDGRPWITNAVTPHKGANTLSPFVQLATRA